MLTPALSAAPCWQTLQEELRGRQPQVSSLQEISSQLLLETAGEDSLEAKEKVHVICNKLRLLLRQVAADLPALHRQLVATVHTIASVTAEHAEYVAKFCFSVCCLFEETSSSGSEADGPGVEALRTPPPLQKVQPNVSPHTKCDIST